MPEESWRFTVPALFNGFDTPRVRVVGGAVFIPACILRSWRQMLALWNMQLSTKLAIM